jgi:Asp-tRNA(Asn)/Glu-tRNA(Gln) amidotransferase A subunit family amidase
MKTSMKKTTGSTSFWAFLTIFMVLLLIIGGAFALHYFKEVKTITTKDIRSAEKITGLRFSSEERRMMRKDLKDNRAMYKALRTKDLSNHIPPALQFNPMVTGSVDVQEDRIFSFEPKPGVRLPDDPDDLAFFSVVELASLIKTRQITSTELTQFYLDRLKTFGPRLKCVITLTEELALQQAKQADQEIAAGHYRGPLHGIPWGAKDLLATKEYKTTWGAFPYKDQVIPDDATVVKRLESAGAVLVAKLSLGALAWGDVWYGGKTISPWDPEKGSSGSSAGPGAATAAGLVAFSIGSETWGSIVSPSTRCFVSGLRPTFGRVSRFGAMALSWSMDKIGPMCRTAEDCALVFNAIYGPDGKDLTLIDHPYEWDPNLDLNEIRVGFLEKAFQKEYKHNAEDLEVLSALKSLGVELCPIELPNLDVRSLSFILSVEAAASFDVLTRSNQDELLVRQGREAWPNYFRQARFIPAVEYVQANRMRTMLMQDMGEKMKNLDVFVTPSFRENVLLTTNLTGHPAVVVPNRTPDKGDTTSITFIGNLFEEAKTLRVAAAYQEATGFHLKHPDLEETLSDEKNE